MAVAQIVDANALNTRLLATSFHLVGEKVLGGVGEPVIGFDEGMGDEVVLHLVGQELWHDDGAHGLLGLGRIEHVLAVQAHVGLGDGYAVALEVEVLRHESQSLTAANSQPVQQFEKQEGRIFVHDLAGESLALILGPEFHFLGLLAAHPADLAHRVGWQVVVANRVVEHGRKLITDAAQVGIAVVEAVGGALILDGVLPVQDVQRRDLSELLFPR